MWGDEDSARPDALVVTAVRDSLLLGSLPQEDLVTLLHASGTLQRQRGELLLRRGSDEAAVLLEGSAKEHRETVDGQELIIRLLAPGDVAGLSTVMDAAGGGELTALEPSRALVIPGEELRRLAHERSNVAVACLRAVTHQLSALRDQVLDFAFSSTAERVVHRLVELTEQWGQPVDHGLRIGVPLTQEELASWADASRESTAKALGELRGAGIIATRRRVLTILDVDALHRRCRTRRVISIPDVVPTVRN